jgi:diacylglycerol kinase (ATP)
MKLRVLFNPAAGRGRARRRITSALRRLHERGASVEFLQSSSADHLIDLAASTRAGDCDRLVICGGDGSLNLTVRRLNLREVPLAIIPLGSGDDFAQTVRIPRDTVAAADLVLDGEEREVDVALANGIRYLGVAGLGFDTEVTAYANKVRRLRGSLVYVYAMTRVLPRFKPRQVLVTDSGITRRETIMFAVVGNTHRYGAGILVVPSAIVDDRQLDLCLVRECSILDLVTTFPLAYSGRHVTRPFVITSRGPEFRFDADPPLDVYADGERLTETPVTMRIAPEPLRVVVPREQ